jgi:transposase-like protein
MRPTYDASIRDAVRQRMSPPNRESVPEIARDTGIAVQTLYSWRSQWQKQGLLVPATSRPPEQWSPADKLATVIQTAGLSGVELGSFCRERGLYPKQVARWRQAAVTSAVGRSCRRHWMRMAPTHRACLTSGNCSEGITSKLGKSDGYSASWRKRRKHSARQPHCWCCQKSSINCGLGIRILDPGRGEERTCGTLSGRAPQRSAGPRDC